MLECRALPMPDTAESRSLVERPLDELIACHERDLLMTSPTWRWV